MTLKSKFIEADRETLYLLPPSLQEWLPEKHLARFVVEFVDQLDLRSLKESYVGCGLQPYNPVMMVVLPVCMAFNIKRLHVLTA